MKRFITLVVLASVVATATIAQRKEAQEVKPEQKSFNEDYSFIDIAQYEGFIPQEPVIYTGDIPVWNLTREETASKESMLKLINQQERSSRTDLFYMASVLSPVRLVHMKSLMILPNPPRYP